jgi:hypothetical protein
MAAKPVDATRFIRIWETSDSLKEVCERTGLQRNSASQRATSLRNKWSVDLKRMKPENPQALNSADLQAVLAEVRASSHTTDANDQPEVESPHVDGL